MSAEASNAGANFVPLSMAYGREDEAFGPVTRPAAAVVTVNPIDNVIVEGGNGNENEGGK